MTQDNDEPTFEVQVIDYGSPMTVLAPQFHPGDLTDDEREVYGALREAGKGHYTGAFTVNEIAESHFEEGETVTLAEAVRRYHAAANEAVEAFREFQSNVVESLAPIISDLAEACQPLVEARREMAESFAENVSTDSDR